MADMGSTEKRQGAKRVYKIYHNCNIPVTFNGYNISMIKSLRRHIHMKHVLIAVAVLSALTLSPAAHAIETLNGAGATFPYPVYSAWAFDYSKVAGIQLNYQSLGSGG